MSTAEDVWRRRTDYEVKAAASRLAEYTDEGKRVILAEFHRRHLEARSEAEISSVGSADNDVLAPRDRIQEGLVYRGRRRYHCGYFYRWFEHPQWLRDRLGTDRIRAAPDLARPEGVKQWPTRSATDQFDSSH